MQCCRLGIISLLILLFSCEIDKTPLSLEDHNYTSHEYEWQVDTLHAPDALQVLMRGIWGTDENNVWVVGHSDEAKYQVWHWDGKEWENHHLLFPGHPHSLNTIHGFSKNDIWAIGTDFQNYPNTKFRGFIIYYNGNNWELMDEVDAPRCFSIWGTSSDNLFVGSDSGLILHYDGISWEKQRTNTLSVILSIWGTSNNEIFAIGAHNDYAQPLDTIFYYFYKYDGKNWEIIHSVLDYPLAPSLPFGSELWGDNNNVLYSVGSDGLYRLENETWHKIRDESLYAIHGTEWNNIFVAGPWNNILHYNGNSWRQLNFFDTYYFDAGFSFWCNQKYVFMTAQKGNRSYVVRGKLFERR